jgi:ketosteroid isomerase-like protein
LKLNLKLNSNLPFGCLGRTAGTDQFKFKFKFKFEFEFEFEFESSSRTERGRCQAVERPGAAVAAETPATDRAYGARQHEVRTPQPNLEAPMKLPAHTPVTRRLLFLLFTLIVAAPANAAAQATQDSTKVPAPLRTARASFLTAISGFDANGAGAHFADSAVVNMQGEVIAGKPAISQGWLPGMFQTLASIRFGGSSYTIAADEVMETGTHYVVPSEGGGEQPGTHYATWRRMADGSWKIVRLEVGG